VRALPGILALCAVVAADARQELDAAARKLRETRLDEVSSEERVAILRGLLRFDEPDAVKPLRDAAETLGDAVDEARNEEEGIHERLRPVASRTALSDADLAKKAEAEARLQRLVAFQRGAQGTLDHLATGVGAYRKAATLDRASRILPGDPSWHVRLLFARAAAAWHVAGSVEDPDRLVETLGKLCRDRDWRVRAGAAGALGVFRRPKALGLLRECLVDADPRVRAAGVTSLREMRGPEAIDTLIQARSGRSGGGTREAGSCRRRASPRRARRRRATSTASPRARSGSST
jgi:HEAT repeat protein